jgi:hypothetical protein
MNEIRISNWRDLYMALVEANNLLSPDNLPMGTFKYLKVGETVVRCEIVLDLVEVQEQTRLQLG